MLDIDASSWLFYYYWYSALGLVWAETRAQSGDRYGSGTLHPGQVLRGSLPLLSPAFRRSHFRHQVPPRFIRNENFNRNNFMCNLPAHSSMCTELLCVLYFIVCTVPLPPGVNPIAVDKYINIDINIVTFTIKNE